MTRDMPGAFSWIAGTLLFCLLTFGAEIGTGMESHAAIALSVVSGAVFGVLTGLWRLARGGRRTQRRW